MPKKIDKSNFDSMGGLSIMDIIKGMGLEFDYSAANVIKYFLRAPYFGQEEEDYRAAMFHLDIIYNRDGFGPVLHKNKVNLGWDGCNPIEPIIIADAWRLSGLRREFLMSFHFAFAKFSTALRILDKLIDQSSDYSDIIGKM